MTLLVCDRLGLQPVPFLIAEVLASNIGGTATLIGDPPNIIIASRANLSFNDFLIHLAPVVVVLMVVFVGLCRILLRSAFTHDPARVAALMALDEREVIRDAALLVKSGMVSSPSSRASCRTRPCTWSRPSSRSWGAGLLVAVAKLDPPEYLEEVEWPSLVFFMGLFIMVGALVETRGTP